MLKQQRLLQLRGLGLLRLCNTTIDRRLRLSSVDRLARQKFPMSSTEVAEREPIRASCSIGASPERNDDAKIRRRRVQFADEVGLELIQVRVMREPSLDPPELPMSNLLASLSIISSTENQTDTASHKEIQPSECRFKCHFEQPVNRYIMYRESLEKHCVALDGVQFEKHGSGVHGSVSVKNLCFNKRVFVRVTFDGWHSFQDVQAAYRTSLTDGCSRDVFAFSFDNPGMSGFELCVGFEAVDLKQSFWDNNSGDNYKVSLKRIYMIHDIKHSVDLDFLQTSEDRIYY